MTQVPDPGGMEGQTLSELGMLQQARRLIESGVTTEPEMLAEIDSLAGAIRDATRSRPLEMPTMATEQQIVMTSVERTLVKRMGQVIDERRINPDVDTFTANDMARAIRAATGVPINYRELGALLDRMGVVANRRDYRREMRAFTAALPEWLKVADSQQVSQIRMPSPTV